MKLESSKTAWFTIYYMKKTWNFFIDVHNVKYQGPISVTTSLKLKTKQRQLRKWAETKNHSI